MSQILLYPAVIESLRSFPNQNVKFKLHEIKMVIALFDSVASARIELEGTKYKIDTYKTATLTKEILSKYTSSY